MVVCLLVLCGLLLTRLIKGIIVPYVNGKVNMDGYMMKEKMMHSKGGKANAKHEGMESKKKKLAEKKMEMKGMRNS